MSESKSDKKSAVPEIDVNKLKIEQTLSTSAHVSIEQATFSERRENITVILRSYHIEASKSIKDAIQKEYETLKTIHHANIVQLRGVCYNPNHMGVDNKQEPLKDPVI